MTIKLSILVLTLPNRIQAFFPKIMKNLQDQTQNYNDIEILALYDNKKRSVGKKRDDIMKLAQGEYMVFIDDDDRIADDYVSSIMNTLYENPTTDCVVFDCICCVNGGYGKLCKYGIEFEYGDILNGKEWRGKPAHTMVYKTSIAQKHPFEDMGSGEDFNWVVRACQDIKEQTRIDKVLYYYDANYTTTSETVGLDDNIIKYNINLLLENEKAEEEEEEEENKIFKENKKQKKIKPVGYTKEEIIEKQMGHPNSLYAFCENYCGTHIEIINNIAKNTNCRSYLELGVYQGECITKIAETSPVAVGIDIFKRLIYSNFEFIQTTTDLFFSKNTRTFDIIFIDADHNFLSVKRNFENSLKILNKHGIIIIHDTDPMYENLKLKGFCNDSYKMINYLDENHSELNYINLPVSIGGLLLINRKSDHRFSAKVNM